MIESSVTATLLLALAAAVTYTLRRHSAGRRHAISVAAFVAILWIPCLANLLPGWHVQLPAIEWIAMTQPTLRSSTSSAAAGSATEWMWRDEIPADKNTTPVSARQRSAPPRYHPRNGQTLQPPTPQDVSSRSSDGRPAAVNNGAKVGSRLDVVRRGMSYLVGTGWSVSCCALGD